MESKSVIDISSESESESKWDPERSTGSGSPSDNDREKRGKQEKKRKMRKRSCKQTGPHSLSTPNKKSQAKDTSQYMRQKYQNKLPVTCGDKKGVLYVEKYNDKQKCILSEGQWFKPNEFEQFGGKGRCKNSTKSILFNGIQLRKLIEDRVLLPIKKRLVQNEQIDSPESSPVTGRLRKRKSREQLLPSTSESHDMGNGDDGNDVDEDDDDRDDDVDMTVFDSPTLPVTCGSKSGILHKCRFAKGHCGRCIRTEDSWLSPDDFIRLNKPNGTWRKDIVTYGIPLGKLIMKRVLEPHMINCDCEICEEKDQYLQNDDVCFVCDSGGDLVCCDECPRAFHSHCHLPAADEDSPGSKWSCTFCVMKKTADSSQKTQQEVLSSPVSQYILHCQYLLLHLLHESMTDPCTNVSGYSENICGPMMLGRVKLNLETNHNQTVQEFVSDIEQIFNNCCTSSGDNDSSRMISRLKEAFKKEFETVFKLL